MLHQALCTIPKPSLNWNWSYSPETLNWDQNWWVFCPVWPWNLKMTLTCDRATLLCYLKLCTSFYSQRSIQTGVTVQKHFIRVKIRNSFVLFDLEIWQMTLKRIGHLFYTTSSFVHHFIAISEFKLVLQSGNVQTGSNFSQNSLTFPWPWKIKIFPDYSLTAGNPVLCMYSQSLPSKHRLVRFHDNWMTASQPSVIPSERGANSSLLCMNSQSLPSKHGLVRFHDNWMTASQPSVIPFERVDKKITQISDNHRSFYGSMSNFLVSTVLDDDWAPSGISHWQMQWGQISFLIYTGYQHFKYISKPKF